MKAGSWLAAVVISILPGFGQQPPMEAATRVPAVPHVQATGEATISARPDRALVEIGVASQAATSTEAAAQNAKQTDAVLAELSRLLGDGKRLRTTTYSVRPEYRNPKPGSAPTVAGYTATNVVEVTLDDLALVGKVIDTATKSGANVLQNLRWELRNREVIRAQALRQAAERARISAESIAAGLGVKVTRVLSAEEAYTHPGVVNQFERLVRAEAASPTPVEAGMIEVRVSVVVRLEIAQ